MREIPFKNSKHFEISIQNNKYFLPFIIETSEALRPSAEKLINDILAGIENSRKKFVVYGKNSNDDTVEKKYKQLISLGFSEVYIYRAGMFEWMLLQDIYGKEEFPTSTKVLDILKYKPPKTFGKYYLEYK